MKYLCQSYKQNIVFHTEVYIITLDELGYLRIDENWEYIRDQAFCSRLSAFTAYTHNY